LFCQSDRQCPQSGFRFGNPVFVDKGMKMKAGSSVLFFAATHGDEGFSVPILQELDGEFPGQLSWLIANEEAFKRGVRFTDADLNRSAPGEISSPRYELRRAAELLEVAKQYRFVIDLHGTTASSGIFVLVPNPTPHNMALAASLPISNVVIWAARSSEQFGPLTQFLDCGVEIECGPKDSPLVWDGLRRILRTIITEGITLEPSRYQRWFRVYGMMPKGALMGKALADFQQAMFGGETFYPLLVGQYEDALCYKMEKVDFWDILSY